MCNLNEPSEIIVLEDSVDSIEEEESETNHSTELIFHLGSMITYDSKNTPKFFPYLKDAKILAALEAINISDTVNCPYKDYVFLLDVVWKNFAEYVVIRPLPVLPDDILQFIIPFTFNTILNVKWLDVSTKVKNSLHNNAEKTLYYFMQTNLSALSVIGSVLKIIIHNPWEDEVLIDIVNREDVSDYKLHKFIESEDILLISQRIKCLIEGDSEDLAMIFANKIYAAIGFNDINYTVKQYIVVITKVINEFERLKVLESDEYQDCEIKLARIFAVLAERFEDYPEISRECILTAFSLCPTESFFDIIKYFHEVYSSPEGTEKMESDIISISSDTETDMTDDNVMDLGAIAPVTGKDFVHSINYSPDITPCRFLDECARSGLQPVLSQALYSAVCDQRFKTLSWMYDWPKLREECERYLKFGMEVRVPTKELKYLHAHIFKD